MATPYNIKKLKKMSGTIDSKSCNLSIIINAKINKFHIM